MPQVWTDKVLASTSLDHFCKVMIVLFTKLKLLKSEQAYGRVHQVHQVLVV